MNRLNTSTASSTNGFPPKQGTWDFLQDANKEIFAYTMIKMIGKNYSNATPYILYGCELTVGGVNTTLTQGAIFLNGEVYYVPAASIVNPVFPQVVTLSKTTTYYTVNADPVQYSGGGAPVNCHEIIRLTIVAGASGSGLADFSTAVPLDNLWTNLTLYNSGGSVAWTNADASIYDAAFQDRGNTIQFCGKITSTAVAGTLPMFTLPTSSRPTKKSVIFAMKTTAAGTGLTTITVNTNGIVEVACDSNTGGITVWLDNLIVRKN